MAFVYFVGCASYQEVKTKYRELVKIHHPDKGGDSRVFVEVANEYALLNEQSYYPVQGSKYSTNQKTNTNNGGGFGFASGYEDFLRNMENAARGFKTYGQSDFAQAQAFAEKQRRMKREREEADRIRKEQQNREPWTTSNDPLYKVLEALLTDACRDFKSTRWCLMEIYKVPDLTLNHFKYIKYLINKLSGIHNTQLADSWINSAYRNYIEVQKITEWTTDN